VKIRRHRSLVWRHDPQDTRIIWFKFV